MIVVKEHHKKTILPKVHDAIIKVFQHGTSHEKFLDTKNRPLYKNIQSHPKVYSF